MCRSIGTVLLSGAMLLSLAAGDAPRRDASLLLESRAAVGRALNFLKARQREDGSFFQGPPAITALAVTAMVGSGREEFGPKSDTVARALAFIRSQAKPDGGIHDGSYAGYNTSVCVMALVEAGLPEDRALRARARDFLLAGQADESENIQPTDPRYGGWGYEEEAGTEAALRPDLSNTQFALEAIHALEQVAEEDTAAAGTGQGARTRTELAYDHAIAFLSRCQNLKATNDQPWAANDGGFVYRPGESKAGESDEGGLRSYAGMTYAGLKSMIYAHLGRTDPRVVAAWNWIRRHWSVTDNPGLGEQGLYYFYLTMARALNAMGEDVIVDANGGRHDWRVELTGQLLKIQRADGSWANENGRWMEQIPELSTAYSALALEQAASGW
jgi:squalene-hopene/tetraprenyl-beta-curcumene cyclase